MDDQSGSTDLTIATARLRLRPLREGDAPSLWPFVSDPGISRFMSWSAHESMAQTESFVSDVCRRMAAGGNVTWVIAESGHVCGIVALIGILRRHRALTYDKGELAYWLGKDFRGRGLATEACQAALRFGFETMGLHKVTVAHVRQNAASRDLIARLGFRRVGVERQHFQKDGRWFDHVIYELLRADWSASAAG